MSTPATIEADATLPLIRITRDFDATPAQLLRAHTDPELYARWVGPNDIAAIIDHWDARTGGSWRMRNRQGDEEYRFYGSFHEVTDSRIVQTFTYEGFPDSVSLETMTFEPLEGGGTRMHAISLFNSFEHRDGMLASGMDVGVNEGYAKLDALLAEGAANA